jgi:hypothetical protein
VTTFTVLTFGLPPPVRVTEQVAVVPPAGGAETVHEGVPFVYSAFVTV